MTFAYLAWLLGYRLMWRAQLPTDMCGPVVLAFALFVVGAPPFDIAGSDWI